MRRVRSAWTALIGAVALILTPVAASAQEGDVPDDVARWFEYQAVESITGSVGVAGENLGDSGLFDTISVGDPVAVSKPTADGQIISAGEWTAAVYGKHGTVVGTVTAWRPPGSAALELAYFDNSTGAGEGIASASESDDTTILVDPLGGGRAILDEQSDTVEPLELGASAQTVETDQYLEEVAEQIHAAEDLPASNVGLSGGTSGGYVADGQAGHGLWIGLGAGGSLLVAVGVVLLVRTRRPSGTGDLMGVLLEDER
ncbi:MAG: hypothetical protein LBS27_02970 [Bifidobacteriaceae bacterium]|jgi:hypothetical protein|nr:hypothetical protein [Bifidobacteriaceae bacterium]